MKRRREAQASFFDSYGFDVLQPGDHWTLGCGLPNAAPPDAPRPNDDEFLRHEVARATRCSFLVVSRESRAWRYA